MYETPELIGGELKHRCYVEYNGWIYDTGEFRAYTEEIVERVTYIREGDFPNYVFYKLNL